MSAVGPAFADFARFLETGHPYWWSLVADAIVAFLAVLGGAYVAFRQDRKRRREQEVSDGARRDEEERLTTARIVYSALEEARMNKARLKHLVTGLRPGVASLQAIRTRALDFALTSPLTFAHVPYSLIIAMRSTAQTLDLVRVRLEFARLVAVLGRSLDEENLSALRRHAQTGLQLIDSVLDPEGSRWLETMPGEMEFDDRVDTVLTAVKAIYGRGEKTPPTEGEDPSD